jgi:hypothetical protein
MSGGRRSISSVPSLWPTGRLELARMASEHNNAADQEAGDEATATGRSNESLTQPRVQFDEPSSEESKEGDDASRSNTQNQVQAQPPAVNSQAQNNTMTEVWKSDPLQGNFNPGTKLGKDIFLEKSKGLPEDQRLDLNRSNASKLHRYFQAREVHMEDSIDIPVEFNGDGSVKTTKNLLTQYHSITLEDCQRAAHARYANKLNPGDPIPASPFVAKDLKPESNEDHKKQFYAKVHSNVVAKIIENGLSYSGYEDLMLSKDSFAFKNPNTRVIEYDGPTMLFLIYTHIDPDTVVGLDAVEKKLENATLGKYKNDVSEMLKDMELNYKILKDNGKAPEKYRKLLLDALISGPNHTFNMFVQRIIDDIESGIGAMANVTADQIVVACRTRYNNMHERGLWDKVSPRDAQIMALTTQLNQLKNQGTQQGTKPAALATTDPRQQQTAPRDVPQAERQKAFQEKRTDDSFIKGLPRWRTIKQGDTIVMDGKTFHWCPHHKTDDWDGLYCIHKPDRCKRKPAKDTAPAAPAPAPAAPTAPSKLDLNSKLKQVLATNLCLSNEDVEKLFDEAASK